MQRWHRPGGGAMRNRRAQPRGRFPGRVIPMTVELRQPMLWHGDSHQEQAARSHKCKKNLSYYGIGLLLPLDTWNLVWAPSPTLLPEPGNQGHIEKIHVHSDNCTKREAYSSEDYYKREHIHTTMSRSRYRTSPVPRPLPPNHCPGPKGHHWSGFITISYSGLRLNFHTWNSTAGILLYLISFIQHSDIYLHMWQHIHFLCFKNDYFAAWLTRFIQSGQEQ